MKRKMWLWIAAAGIVLIGSLIWIGIRNTQNALGETFQTFEVQRGDLIAVVGGTGTVRANQTTVISWQTPGRIGKIYVQMDDQVVRNQILAELDPATLSQSIITAKSELVSAKRVLSDLQNSDVARAQSELALSQATLALKTAQDNRNSLNYQRTSTNTLDGIRANYYLAEDAVEQAEELFSAFQDRAEDDPGRAAALSVLVNARKNRDRALANLNYALGKPDIDQVAEADAKVAVAEANLKDAEREWERLQDGVDPDDIAAAEARVQAIEAALELAFLKAPIAGQITMIDSKEGDQVSPGVVSFRLDDLSVLLVDVDIPEVDINQVDIGQTVTLTFDAVRDKGYSGEVVEVARVGSVSPTGVNFTVTIKLLNPDASVLPGMTAAVNIVVNRVENVLLVPNRAVRFRDGQQVIYILAEGASVPEKVEIKLGLSSELYSEVLTGLKEGDRIIVNPPAEFSGQQGGPFGGG